MSFLMIVACVGIYAGACNPKDEPLRVNISGLSDQAAAEHIADTMCQQMAVCGQASFECSSSGPGGDPPVCSGELTFVTYNECYQEIHPDILADLEQVELTPAQEQLVNDCMNGMLARNCMTQADVDEIVDALNRGEEPDWEEDLPASCDQMEEIFGNTPVTDPQPGTP